MLCYLFEYQGAQTIIREAALNDCTKIAGLLGELGYPATEQFARDQLARFSSRPDVKVLVEAIGYEQVNRRFIKHRPSTDLRKTPSTAA